MSDAQPNHAMHGRNPANPLVKMVNQIAVNMTGAGDQHAAAIAAHITKFWSPSMRRQIRLYLAGGGTALNPAAQRAVELLAEC